MNKPAPVAPPPPISSARRAHLLRSSHSSSPPPSTPGYAKEAGSSLWLAISHSTGAPRPPGVCCNAPTTPHRLDRSSRRRGSSAAAPREGSVAKAYRRGASRNG
ncbi:hypothetical protein DAI22_08g145100 [Oryza sativa Japonica Group]|nr:hypothetical protein DAI22_08g145100 [Oryza sativa Japonica Group]